ncbi:MAG: hypothetical protein IBJ09_09225 [Bacteroidia bacterium]|nr:hypothetical protein [Bacteroidia bacterium]
MDSLFNFQIGTFAEASPGWFDWLSLIISVSGIFAAYGIAKHVFKKEQREKLQNDGRLRDIEMKIFKQRIFNLYIAISNQIKKLSEDSDSFVLEVIAGINVDFLLSTDFVKIYEEIGVNNEKEIEALSNLMADISGLSNIPNSLREEGRRFNEMYNFHEQKFYSYRKLLGTHFHKLCNSRKVSVSNVNGLIQWKFQPGDSFMFEYQNLLDKTYRDESIIKDGLIVSRELLTRRFVVKLMDVVHRYILTDADAVSTKDLGNEVILAHDNMEEVKRVFELTKKSYKEILEKAKESIEATRLIS